jgi:hypothetical protein
MAQAGDRVAIHTSRVGQAPREGEVLAMAGSLLRVRWDDGAETLVTSGSVAVLPTPASPGAEATQMAAVAEKGGGMVVQAAERVKKGASEPNKRLSEAEDAGRTE